MKPHTMLFDEYYQERFYRNETVEKALLNADTLLLVGTAFYTTLASRIVRNAVFKRMNIVEVNLESHLG